MHINTYIPTYINAVKFAFRISHIVVLFVHLTRLAYDITIIVQNIVEPVSFSRKHIAISDLLLLLNAASRMRLLCCLTDTPEKSVHNSFASDSSDWRMHVTHVFFLRVLASNGFLSDDRGFHD